MLGNCNYAVRKKPSSLYRYVPFHNRVPELTIRSRGHPFLFGTNRHEQVSDFLSAPTRDAASSEDWVSGKGQSEVHSMKIELGSGLPQV
jgi:hypothetical protein